MLAVMKRIIEAHRTKRIETAYLEDEVRKKKGIAYLATAGGYEALARHIENLCEEGYLVPVKASGTNGRKPLLYNKYHIQGDNKEVDKAVLLSYHPKIQADFYINHPQNYGEDKSYLELLDVFLKDSRMVSTLNLPFSVNERSYQIFRDEKFLSCSRGQEFCRRISLGWQELGCYLTYEPFFYVLYEVDSIMNGLVLENKDSFFTLKKVFNQTFIQDISAEKQNREAAQISSYAIRSIDQKKFDLLIYGEGKKILHSLGFIEEIPDCRNAKITLYYFGDLDYEGISIYGSLVENYPDYDIVPFCYLYRQLLNTSPRYSIKNQRPNERHLASFLKHFTEEEREAIINILGCSKYIPQEALAYPFFCEECQRVTVKGV